jgi:hypothetical protein
LFLTSAPVGDILTPEFFDHIVGTAGNHGKRGLDKPMRESYYRGLIGVALLSMSVLACRPVITVGWSEVAVLFVIAAIIVGPLLFRLYRLLAVSQESKNDAGEGRKKGE